MSSQLRMQQTQRNHHGDLFSQDAGPHSKGKTMIVLLQDVKPPASFKHFHFDLHLPSAGNQFLMKFVQNVDVSVLKNTTKPAKPQANSRRRTAGACVQRTAGADGAEAAAGLALLGSQWKSPAWRRELGVAGLVLPGTLTPWLHLADSVTQNTPGSRGCFSLRQQTQDLRAQGADFNGLGSSSASA